MKKLIFTALAVVAFSGVSMANTKEVKPNVKKKEAVLKTRKVLRMNICQILGTMAANDVFMATGDMGAATSAGVFREMLCNATLGY